MQVIIEDIKQQQFHHMYLLFGEEKYLVNLYRDKLVAALGNRDDSMNCSFFSGKDVSVQSIIDLAQTLPFFADRRVIVWENSELFASSSEEMAGYMAEVPESTYFIFTEQNVEKRNKMYKAVTQNGHAAECIQQEEAELKKWILTMMRKDDKKITVAALDQFMDMTGNDMYLIRSEAEKLLCYCMDKSAIELQDVEAVCCTKLTGKIFAMIEAVANKRQQEALNLYYDLLALKEPPMKILFWIGKQFTQLLSIKDLRERGYDKNRIAQKMGIKPYFAGKYVEQAAKFDKRTLYAALRDCAEADENIKMGKMTDQLSVETLLVKYSNPLS